MATYYAATTGNDANPGTIGSPKLTVAAAVALATTSGDIVYLRGGTYTGADATIDSQGHTVGSGSSWSVPITISSYPGETAILQPADNVSGVRLYTAVSYIVIQDLTIDMSVSTVTAPDAVILANCDHIRFQRIDAKDGPAFGFHSGPETSFIEVLDCRIHGFTHTGTVAGDNHGLYMSGTDALYDGNEVYNNAGYGFHIYSNTTPTTAPSRVICRNNIVHDNGTHIGGSEHGIVVAHGTDNHVYNNIVYDNAGGIQIYTNAMNTLVANNTIYNNAPYSGIWLQSYRSGTVIRNNIIYGNTTSIVDYGGGSGSYVSDHNFTNDPLFTNAGSADFTLQTGSGAIDFGTTVAEVETDFLGFGRPNGTGYDAGAYESGATGAPAIATNISAATARLITRLPYTITVDTSIVDSPHTVWFKYNPTISDTVLGALAWADVSIGAGNYQPSISVWTGMTDSLTAYLSFTDVVTAPIQFPVTFNTTYYFSVTNDSIDPIEAPLVFSLIGASNGATAISDILITDDQDGFPAAIVGSDGTVKRYVLVDAVQGQTIGLLSSGTFAIGSWRTAGFQGVNIYTRSATDGTPELLKAIDFAPNDAPGAHVTAVQPDHFYASTVSGGTNTLRRINLAGTVTATWTLPAGALAWLAVATDDSIAYWTSNTAAAIKQYDLVGSAALSDLVASLAGYTNRDILVLSDGTLLVGYTKNSPRDNLVKHYSAAGATLNTYTLEAGTSTLDHIALATDNPVSFWTWTKVGNVYTYTNIRVSDGAVLSMQVSRQFTGGVGPNYFPSVAYADIPRFGVSDSCPFVPHSIPTTAPTTVPTTPPTVPPIEHPNPCCPCDCHPTPGTPGAPGPPGPGSPPGGGTPTTEPPGNPGPVIEPIDPTTWEKFCIGGGTVLMALDLIDYEDWAA